MFTVPALRLVFCWSFAEKSLQSSSSRAPQRPTEPQQHAQGERENCCLKEEQSSHSQMRIHIITHHICCSSANARTLGKAIPLVSCRTTVVTLNGSSESISSAETWAGLNKWWGGKQFIAPQKERGVDKVFTSRQTLLEVPDMLLPAVMVCGSELRQALTVRLSAEIKKNCCVSNRPSRLHISVWWLSIWSCSDLIKIIIITRCYFVYSSSMGRNFNHFLWTVCDESLLSSWKINTQFAGQKWKQYVNIQNYIFVSEKEQAFTIWRNIFFNRHIFRNFSTNWGISVLKDQYHSTG